MSDFFTNTGLGIGLLTLGQVLLILLPLLVCLVREHPNNTWERS